MWPPKELENVACLPHSLLLGAGELLSHIGHRQTSGSVPQRSLNAKLTGQRRALLLHSEGKWEKKEELFCRPERLHDRWLQPASRVKSRYWLCQAWAVDGDVPAKL